MIKEKYVIIKWCNSNKKYYISKGYAFTKYGETFSVKIEDLPKSSEVKITAICGTCGIEKNMTFHAYNHITNNDKKTYQCCQCFNNKKELKYYTIKNDVESSGYTLITKANEYKNGNTRIKYLCPKHGLHEMKANNFHNGRRCPLCRREEAHDRFCFSPDTVYEEVRSLGGKLLNKEDYINQSIKNLRIICPRCHKNIFITSLRHYTQHGGQSCPECRQKESVGERRIRQWLENNSVEFIQEKFFDDCRDNKPLPFDFYLPEQNMIIEFDGQQHFEENHFFKHSSSKFKNSITSYTKYHDSIKTEYCISHNITLIRIPYTQLNNVENILNEKIIA